MKSILSLSFAILLALSLNAQVGIGTTAPEAALDIVSATDGLLIPRVILVSESDALPLTAPAEGELVFNTAVVGSLTPGFYYWSSGLGSWVRIGDTVTPPPPPPSFGAWLLGGNDAFAGDLLGTTNNADLVFIRGNNGAGRIGASNTSFGLRAGVVNVGTANTYIGVNAGALFTNGTASNNVAVGSLALQGASNSLASQSVAIGAQALQTPGTNAANNIAIGFRAGITTSGSNSIMIGADTVIGAAQGSIAIGANARSEFTSSIAIGFGAVTTATGQMRLGNNSILEVVTTGIVKAPSFLATGTNTPYADYVFQDYFHGVSKIKSDYKFNTLEKAEAFVIKNGHLPGVKSYAEVMKNGFQLDLTDATVTNLEKLEEQFLYITELNKKISTQGNTIQTQDEKIKALEARLERIEMLLKD